MTKYALLMGLNYTGTNNALGGCINDVINLKYLLRNKFGYREDQITVMTDNDNGQLYPNRKNIIKQLEYLVSTVERDGLEECWISYSGHGSYTYDFGGDEDDFRDETLCPLDYDSSGPITDDVIHSYLARLPSNCKVICLFDCCHSGTICDLKYRHNYHVKPSETRTVERVVKVPVKKCFWTSHRLEWIQEEEEIPETWGWSTESNNQNSTIRSQVIALSGCRDPQTSADVFSSSLNSWNGALTTAFINAINSYGTDILCGELYQQLTDHMKRNQLSQIPVICSSHNLMGDKSLKI